MKEVDIPAYLDNPPQVLFLEMDDLLPLFAGLSIGVISRYVAQSVWPVPVGIIVGAMLTYTYMKYKRDALPGALLHFLFSRGLGMINKRFKNGFIKRFDN